MKAERCSALFFCGFFVIERKIDVFLRDVVGAIPYKC